MLTTFLGIDLGTHCGLALLDSGELTALTKHLATDKEIRQMGKNRQDRRHDCRIGRLYSTLRTMPPPDAIIFEDVEFQSYRLQTQLWSSLRAAIWLAFPHALIECVPTGTLKLFATGYGGASKELMAKALKKQHPTLWSPDWDDNAVDAVWLALWGQRNLARAKFENYKDLI